MQSDDHEPGENLLPLHRDWKCMRQPLEHPNINISPVTPFVACLKMTYQKSSTKKAAVTGRGKRKREVAKRVKQVDFSVIQEARARRLKALENDSHAAEHEASLLEGDDEYNPQLDSDEEMTSRKKTPRPRSRKQRRRHRALKDTPPDPVKSGIERFNKSTHAAMDDETPSIRPKAMATSAQIAALPSSRPPRYFCATCGFKAPYTCTRCYTRFCSVKCNEVHQETRCLKFTA